MISPKPVNSVDGLIGRVPVRLRSDLRHVLDDFAALYTPLSPFVLMQPAAMPIEIEVRQSGRSRWGRRLYRVTADGYEVGGLYPGYCIFPLIEWGINLRIMATRCEFLQLHAASMTLRGHGFVFAGDSGCGKSTLAATLLAAGWQYLCDEFALVDPQTLTLVPFPKALCIKAGSYEAVRKLGLRFERRRDHVKAFKGRVGYINPRKVGPNSIGESVPVRFIVLPRFESGQAATLREISRAEAAAELYRCCFNKSALPECGLGFITALVRQARCFRLAIGSPAQTTDILESLLTDSVVPSGVQTSQAPRQRRRKISERMTSRREMLKVGAKLAYVAPCVLTLTSRQAFAAASNPSGICSTASHTGQLCETDMDCCSRECNLGVCQ